MPTPTPTPTPVPTGYTYGDVGGCNCAPACSPCALPMANLMVAYTALNGVSGSAVLAYLGYLAPYYTWSTACITAGSTAVGGLTAQAFKILIFCQPDVGTVYSIQYYFAPACASAFSVCYTADGGLTTAGSTCSPLNVTVSVAPGMACPVFTGTLTITL
jgi:hypothetical protein